MRHPCVENFIQNKLQINTKNNMDIGQFIILCMFFLLAIGTQIANTCIQIDKRKLNKIEFLLQLSGMMATIIIFGLGVMTEFLGVYNN